MAQTTTTIATLPVQQRANGLVHTGARAVPAAFSYATISMQCTTGNAASPFTGFAHAFSDPAMAVEFGAQWSWDGGTTWPEQTAGTQNGSATGTWGTDRHTQQPVMAPTVSIGIPNNPALGGRPTHYRAGMLVTGGPITFGVTITETTD